MSETLLDSYSEANFNDYADITANYDSDYSCYSQSFMTPNDGISYILSKITLYAKKFNGTETGTIRADIYAHTGTYGTSSKPTGSILASSNAVNVAAELTTSMSLFNFIFTYSNRISLTPNTAYVLVVKGIDLAGASFRIRIGKDTTSPTHSGNECYHVSAAFLAEAHDLCFYVYGDVPNWLTGWGYRKKHDITASSGAGTGYPVKIIVHYGSGSDSTDDVYTSSHCKTDFGDIRFTASDKVTELSYWRETKTDSDNAVYWVKINDNLDSSTQSIYIYYGKSDASYPSLASEAAHGTATFSFFDDFSGDLSKWTTYTKAPTIVSGVLTCYGDAGSSYSSGCKSTSSFGIGYSIRCKSKLTGLYGWVNAWTVYNTSLTDYSVVYTDSVDDWRSSTAKSSSDDTYTSTTDFDSSYHVWDNSRISTSLIRITKDGSSFNDHTTSSKIPTVDLPVNFYVAGSGYKVEVDYVLVRKIIATEPANSTWYDEEYLEHDASLTVNSNLQKTFLKTFTANSNLSGVLTKTFTVNSSLLKNQNKTFTVNGSLLKTQLTTFTVNASLYIQQTKTFTLGADLFVLSNSSLTVNATLEKWELKANLFYDVTDNYAKNIPKSTFFNESLNILEKR
ncbi:MAG: DUF2341 domain-containing protein [Candidatus Bathyarchaeia archaeon]